MVAKCKLLQCRNEVYHANFCRFHTGPAPGKPKPEYPYAVRFVWCTCESGHHWCTNLSWCSIKMGLGKLNEGPKITNKNTGFRVLARLISGDIGATSKQFRVEFQNPLPAQSNLHSRLSKNLGKTNLSYEAISEIARNGFDVKPLTPMQLYGSN